MVCLASAVLLFNVTAPNVALPAIAADPAAGFTAQQWVLSSYALVMASLQLAGGALGDRHGRRRWFLLGLAVFGLGSLVCTLAATPLLLVGGRVLQGIGAAALFPCGLALLAAEFAGPDRVRAIGVWGACVSGAIAVGPLLGGLLVQLAGWRMQFALAFVLVLPAAAVGLRHLRESRDADGARLDRVGTGLLTGALVLLVVLVQRAGAAGWTSPSTLGMIAGAVLLFGAFLTVEFRIPDPLIPPALLRNPTFVGATAVALVFAAAGFAPLVYITLFLLQVVGSGPTLAGLQVAPFAVASLVVSLFAARVVGRLGMRNALAGGLALCGVGLGGLLVLTPDSGGLALLPGLVVFGVAAGIVNPAMTVAALSTVDAAHSGTASGVNNTARQVGIAAGIAAFGAVLQARLGGEVSAALAGRGVPEPVAMTAGRLAAAGDLPAAARALGPAGDALPEIYDAAFANALATVFLGAIGVVVVGVVLTVILIRPAPSAGPASLASARLQVVGDREGRPTGAGCGHLDRIGAIVPSSPDGCADCLREGSRWVHLRGCLHCGHVGCCDSSPRRHAAAHWHATGHAVVRSLEPGEQWGWCYSDELLLGPTR